MRNKAKIRYGVLGCGKHALLSHAIPARNLSGLELTTICDVSENQLNLFEEAYGRKLKKFRDKTEFLRSNIDAVLIGTPDEFHYKDLKDCIDAKKHVFVEKPLATKESELAGLRRVLNLARNRRLVVISCHPRRYDPPFLWLKSALPGIIKKVGPVVHFGFDFSYHEPSKSWKHDRGLLLDHANHEIDLLNFLFGATSFEAYRLEDTFDKYVIVGMRNDGIDFSFRGTRKLKSKTYSETVFIRFERGDLRLDAEKGKAKLCYHETGSEEDITVEPTNYEERGKRTLLNFLNTINRTEKPYLSHSDLYVNTAMSVILSEKTAWRYKHGNNS